MYINLAIASYTLACVVPLLCIAIDGMLSLHLRMRDGAMGLLCPQPPSLYPEVRPRQA